MAGAGWSSCRYIPTSFAMAVLAVLGCARIDVMNASDNMMLVVARWGGYCAIIVSEGPMATQ